MGGGIIAVAVVVRFGVVGGLAVGEDSWEELGHGALEHWEGGADDGGVAFYGGPDG